MRFVNVAYHRTINTRKDGYKKIVIHQPIIIFCVYEICKNLWTNLPWSKVMLVGSKAQLKSLNVDEFILNYEGMPLELVENAKYSGMTINSDISWDFHVQRLCQNMHYHLSLLRRLRRIFPKELLLQVYKSYVQPRLDYGITLYGCSTQNNIDLIQRVQNHAARLITGNFDYINCRGIKLVKSLNLYTIRDRRDYFLTILMFKSIHGIAPTYLSDRVVMNFDVDGYDTSGPFY